MTDLQLHPEGLLDRERSGDLTLDERLTLDAHAAGCEACELQRRLSRLAGQRGRVARAAPRVRLGRVVDAAAAQWLSEMSRKRTRRQWARRWMAILPLSLSALLGIAGVLWGRHHAGATRAADSPSVGRPLP